MQVTANNGQGRTEFVCSIAGEPGSLFVAGSQMVNQVIEVPNEVSKFAKEMCFRNTFIGAVKLHLGELDCCKRMTGFKAQ